jgi:NTP pyrophosphatase (non-canonical NTP hydrolase)
MTGHHLTQEDAAARLEKLANRVERTVGKNLLTVADATFLRDLSKRLLSGEGGEDTAKREQIVAKIVARWLRVREDEIRKGHPLTGTPNGIAQEILRALPVPLSKETVPGGGDCERGAAAMLAEFHARFNYGKTIDPSLRLTLHQEEHDELVEAIESGDLEAIARELADVVYVAYGSAWSLGLDLDAAIREVHRANMSKLGDDGKPVYREDGKVLKGPNFRPPDLRLALEGHPVVIDQERGGIFLADVEQPTKKPEPDGEGRTELIDNPASDPCASSAKSSPEQPKNRPASSGLPSNSSGTRSGDLPEPSSSPQPRTDSERGAR